MREGERLREGITRPARVVSLLHAGFVLIGVVNTMLGVILPELSGRWQLDDAQAGGLFIVQSVGAMAGSALSGLIVKRIGFTALLAIGYCVMAAGAVALGLGSWVIGVVAISAVGCSFGLTIPTSNLLIAELNPERRAAALNLLNLAWGMGAVGGPLLIPTLSRAGGLSFALLCLAVPAIFTAAFLARTPIELAATATDGEAVPSPPAARFPMTAYLLLTGALVFVNVGTESAVGGWIASYVQRLSPASQVSWAVAPSLFWAGLLAGRAAAPLVLRRMKEASMILAGTLLAVCGLLVMLWSAETNSVLVGAGLTGLGLAPIFPNTIALFTERIGADAPRLTGAFFLLAGLGAAVFPWLVGLASSYYGGLRAGLIVPLAGGCVMIGLQSAIMLSMARGK